MIFTPNPPINNASSTLFFPIYTSIIAMWWSIVINATIAINPGLEIDGVTGWDF
jgi:hypothetical protein